MPGVPFLALFALLAAWAYFRGHRTGWLVLWSVMLGISLAGTRIGQGTHTLVVQVMSALWTAILAALHGVAG